MYLLPIFRMDVQFMLLCPLKANNSLVLEMLPCVRTVDHRYIPIEV